MIRVQRNRSCHSNEMTLLPILHAAIYISTLGTILSKSFTGAFSSNSGFDVREVYAKSVRALSRYFGMKIFGLETQ